MKTLLFLLLVTIAKAQDACNTPVTLSGNVTLGSANPYLNNQKCRWIINAEPQKVIRASFNGRFDIEQSSGCRYDYVVIYDSDAVDQVLRNGVCSSTSLQLPGVLGSFCGFEVPSEVIVSSSNRVVIEFCSDSSSTGTGFDLKLEEAGGNVAPQEGSDCNIDIEVDTKYNINFYNKSGYESYKDCTYVLKSKSGKPLKVNADHFDMEGYMGCRYDSVKISEGDRLLGTFCGKNGPKDVRSESGEIKVKFVSDQYTSGKGFNLRVEETCGKQHLCAKLDAQREDECYDDSEICDGSAQCHGGDDESSCDSDCGSSSWDIKKPFPGAAAITHIDGLIQCSAALINKNYLLTNAHCFHRLDDKPHRFVVKMGSASLAGAYVLQIDSIRVHPLFNPKNLANNLALVKLAKPAPIQASISPFCVPNVDQEDEFGAGAQCFTFGWGRTQAQNINSYVQSVKNLTASIVSNSQCRFSSSPVLVNEQNICATTSGKLCYGDNGAPLVCRTKNGRWQVAGINSVAFGCTSTQNIPASFTKVNSYRQWIVDNAFV